NTKKIFLYSSNCIFTRFKYTRRYYWRALLFSAFVFQSAVRYFVVIPLLMLSVPRSFFRKNIWDYRIKFVVNIAGHPWLTLFMFNGLLSIFLIPSVHSYLIAHPVLLALS